jgi:hypothetical protein
MYIKKKFSWPLSVRVVLPTAGVTRSTMLQSKSCFLLCFSMFLVWPLQKQNQNHKQNCFCNMLLTSSQFDICFEAIVLSPIKSCHVTSWTQKVRSAQRLQPKRSTVDSLDQIWQIIVRAFRRRIEQHVTTLYGDRTRLYEYFLWRRNVSKWPWPWAEVKNCHLYHYLV